MEGIGAEHFYDPKHSLLFCRLLTMQSKGEEIEFVTLIQRLLNNGECDRMGGPSYITEIYTYAPSPGHFRAHLGHIKDKFILRRLMAIGNGMIAGAMECGDEPLIVLDDAEREIMAIRDASTDPEADSQTIRKDINNLLADFQRRVEGKQAAKGIPTGYEKLDEMTGGLKPGEMIVLAARPSMGKTSLMMNIVESVCVDQGHPCMVFSCEMSRAQIVDRMTYSRAKFDIKQLDRGHKPTKHEMERIRTAAIAIGNAPLHLDDKSAPTINEIRAKARRHKRKHGLALVAIDYLQLCKSLSKQATGSREREIAEISAGIKGMAKDLNIPVIVLAQINRESEKRGGSAKGRPMMSDLRESGAIEQDADVIGFLFRPEQYANTEEERTALNGKAELIIAKNRNGGTGSAPLTFIKEMMRFETGSPIPEEAYTPAAEKNRW